MNSLKLQHRKSQELTLVGLIVTLGIVYGDIGTSPLYVMSAILKGTTIADFNFVAGAISCIFWTLMLQTTVKYVFITLRADNKGEGGIFALYALIRRKKKWVYLFAIIGGATLLADGIITPAITVVSAIEGLKIQLPNIPIVPISILVISLIFIAQQFGTKSLGKSFGPIMLLWFVMLGVLGFIQILKYPQILYGLNPKYAYMFLAENPNGFILLGAVFLCTTGAEALYSDLGHCGAKNIRISWIFVKTCLMLNYLGQGAYIMFQINKGNFFYHLTNPFYAIMPQWFIYIGVIMSTAAAIIASQALISGSFSIISEAIPLNLFPRVQIRYPSIVKGQMYIPLVNWFLFFSCCFVVLFFKESAKMEAAYGLSITITMLMTTILMSVYLLYKVHIHWVWVSFFALIFASIELAFLYANLQKFLHGGYVTLFIAGFLFVIMYVWFKGRQIKKRFTQFVRVQDYANILSDMRQDETIPKYCSNLVYLTRADHITDIESKIIYSIINKQPKRADTYWFIHVHIMEEPFHFSHTVDTLIPNVLYRIEFKIGFKINPRINTFFRHTIEELVINKQFDITSKYPSLAKYNISGDFRFVLIDRVPTYDIEFTNFEKAIMNMHHVFSNIGVSDVKAFGLDTSNVLEEKVPLQFAQVHQHDYYVKH